MSNNKNKKTIINQSPMKSMELK